ncbi:MAG: 4Fe-4S cluster-binding domain-containing protein [Kiritimatiellia bacterium]
MPAYFVSKFTNFYPSRRETKLLFHGVTGALDEVSPHLAKLLHQTRSQSNPITDQNVSETDITLLVSRGHLTIYPPTEEQTKYEEYVAALHSKRREVKSSYVMIIPSYSCNLRCPYCFQNSLRDDSRFPGLRSMVPSFAEMLFKRTIPNLLGSNYNRMHLTLYGGEPFTKDNYLAIATVLKYTQQRDHQVTAITNGTNVHLFPEFFGPEMGLVSGVQISLDGPKHLHDKSRVPGCGGETFETITKNAKLLADNGVEVVLRVNVTTECGDYLSHLATELEERGLTGHPRIGAYCRAVHEVHTPSSQDKFPEVFTQWKLTHKMEELKLASFSSPLHRTCSSINSSLDTENGVKLNRTSFCMQNRPSAFIFDQLGDVYGCYDEAGYRSLRIGEVDSDGVAQLNDRYKINQTRTLISHEPCRSMLNWPNLRRGVLPWLAQQRNHFFQLLRLPKRSWLHAALSIFTRVEFPPPMIRALACLNSQMWHP